MENTCSSGCCGSSSCSTKSPKKLLNIDFLFLDLDTCERCCVTESNLDDAIIDVSAVLKMLGYEVIINKINITTKDLAIKHKFISSPTIRINDNDIMLDVVETFCKECSDICGTSVDCRAWIYEGVEYDQPPKAQIIDAILRELYTSDNKKPQNGEYKLPENLELYFNSLENK